MRSEETKSIALEIADLTKRIEHYNEQYYNNNVSEISDYEFDKLLRRLEELEKSHPHLKQPNSPTEHIGGVPSGKFKKVVHKIKMESLQNAFNFSELAQFEVMLIRAYIDEGTEGTHKYHAEVHKNCTITPQSVGGSAYVDMPITINFSNDKELGTVNGYTKNDTITFTPNTPNS